MVKEKEATRTIIEGMQVQKALLEQQLAPEVQEAASRRKRDHDAKLQEILRYMEGRTGEAETDMAQSLRHMLAENEAAHGGMQCASGMETDGLDADPSLEGGGLDDVDFDSEPAYGLAIPPTPPMADAAPRRGRGSNAEHDKSEPRSRSASSRRRKLDSGKPAGA